MIPPTPQPQPTPTQIALGAPLSAYDVIVNNLIPVTLGNWVGGFIGVGTAYSLAYGAPGRCVTELFSPSGKRPRGAAAAAAARGGAPMGGGVARHLSV
jgi:hypothetical protein